MSLDTTSSATTATPPLSTSSIAPSDSQHVHVWHCNDAKAACGSHLDRHQNIGKGTIGLAPFRRLLNDPRLAHAAFIAETPIDEPLDDLANVNALKKLVKASHAKAR